MISRTSCGPRIWLSSGLCRQPSRRITASAIPASSGTEAIGALGASSLSSSLPGASSICSSSSFKVPISTSTLTPSKGSAAEAWVSHSNGRGTDITR